MVFQIPQSEGFGGQRGGKGLVPGERGRLPWCRRWEECTQPWVWGLQTRRLKPSQDRPRMGAALLRSRVPTAAQLPRQKGTRTSVKSKTKQRFRFRLIFFETELL